MKKLAITLTLCFTCLFITSCTQIKKKPSREMSSLMKTVQVNDEIFEKESKTDEYTHEMAEASAEDNDIKKEVGVADIDEELPGSEDGKIPYSRNFLLHKKTKRMEFWVDYFTKKNRDRFQRFINNGEEYREIIETTFQEHGLPKELYYVGLIESGYYLGARSHASAVGPWQFIKGTGSRYGLKISSELDERQDLFKASKAAAMYFKDLHNVFSSWELALSAYNAGEYGIIRRIMKHGTRDFYELSRNKQLPTETINYVPKVLAAMYVINNAAKYGFIIPKKKHRLFDLTELRAVKKNVSLSTVAKRLNIEVGLLVKLNPELRQNVTPKHFAGTYFLRVPKSKYSYRLDEVGPSQVAMLTKPESVRELKRRTASVETSKIETNARPRFYRVKKGDSLFSIARRFETTPKALASVNSLKSWKSKVTIGQRLKVNNSNEKIVIQESEPKVKITNKLIVYKVLEGDNLTDLARLFDLKVSEIKTANKLKRGNIQVGQRIIMPDTKKGIYIVKKGDQLRRVARELNQPVELLVKLNSLKRGAIYPGQKIIVNMD